MRLDNFRPTRERRQGGASLSIGHRALRGRRVSLGVAGNSLYCTERVPDHAPPPAPAPAHRVAFVLLVVAEPAAIYWLFT
jgi:hypothetical protein